MDSEINKDCRSRQIKLQDSVALAPQSPGTYRFLNANNRVIYVGKATNLKNRLRSHLLSNDESSRHKLMIQEAISVDWIIVTNEIEALILEDSLIKKHRPDFNVKMRDDKRYPLIRLSINEPYPFITVVRRGCQDGALYFGPYPSPRKLRIVLRLINKHFTLRKCTTSIPKKRSRPCIHYQMKQCSGICSEQIDSKTYMEVAHKVQLLLAGRSSDLLNCLEHEMLLAASTLEYEKAAHIRDQIRAIQHVSRGRDLLIPRPVDIDVIVLQVEADHADAECLMVRAGVISGNINWFFEIPDESQTSETMERLLVQYYSSGIPIPGTILCSHLPSNLDQVEQLLRKLAGKRVCIRKPERGLKLRLMKIAYINLQHHSRISNQQLTLIQQKSALHDLQNMVALQAFPTDIEAIDISDTQGDEAVGSVVHFRDGIPLKSMYRRYKIKSVNLVADTQRITEVFRRRIARSTNPGWTLPNLFIIDGGVQHLKAVMSVLEESSISVNVVSIAKIRNKRDSESMFLHDGNEISLDPNHSVTLLLDRIRDEAHRFAITYHRDRRDKKSLKSQFLNETKVSLTVFKRLLQRFDSIAGIVSANEQELLEIPGVGLKTLRKIQQCHHQTG